MTVDMSAVHKIGTELLVVLANPDCFANDFCIRLYPSHTRHRYWHILHLWRCIEGST